MDPSQLQNQLTPVLLNCQSADQNQRTLAEKWLQDLEKQNLPLFYQLLCTELANNEKPVESRTLSGIVLKNSLVNKKDPAKNSNLNQRWCALDNNVRIAVKNSVLSTLATPVKEVRLSVAMVVAAIAFIELPKNMWPELITQLLNNMQIENEQIKQATLETLGYICEEVPPQVMETQSNQILTAICKGIKDASNDVKHAACSAMFNSLQFVKANFEKEIERNYIMQVLCEAAIASEPKVRVAALECLVKIASLYYDKLVPYMQRLFNITLEAIKKDTDEVAQQGVEFWCTICEEEIDINFEAEEAAEMKIEPSRFSSNFIRGALKFLVPILTETLTKQDDEPDEDTWNVAMAAGTCLSLVANTSGDEVIPHVMPFIEQNINNPNWKFREAATLAFGAVLEGPKGFISQLVTQAMPVLLEHMKDPMLYVKDTTAWTIGRICQLHPQAIGGMLPQVIAVLANCLSDGPKVAANVCWAFHNLALAHEDDVDKTTGAMSPYFQGLLEKLVQVTVRQDVDESNLRPSAYEAINVLIQNCAKDCLAIVVAALPVFIDRLEKTFQIQILSQDDREEQQELQSLLCGLLQVITQRLGDGIKPFADKMMALYLQVFSAKSVASVHEEALMAVGAIANSVESEFEKYMQHFRPFLMLGLKNYEEYQVCAVAVGVVGDVSRALNIKMVPYCDEIVSVLLQDLQNPHLHRSVKPPILSCFGDVALAIGQEFLKYLPVVMNMLQQASQTQVDQNDYDLVDYLNQLREGIFEAFTGIIQGLRSDNVADPNLLQFVPHIINFVGFVHQDSARSESVTRGAIGVLGDIAHSLGAKVKHHLTQNFVKSLINECIKSDDPQTKDVAQWAKDVISKL